MAKITRIKVTNAKKEHCEIHLDDRRIINANLETVYNNFLDKGKEIDEDLIEKLASEFEYLELREYAKNIVSKCFYTEHEMKIKLRRRSHNEESIEKVIAKLVEYKYLDDALYAEKYIKDAKKLKKYGELKIKVMLKQKGISQSVINQKLEETRQELEGTEYENALKLCIKKSKMIGDIENYKRRRKLYTYLATRGYDSTLVKKVLDEEEAIRGQK